MSGAHDSTLGDVPPTAARAFEQGRLGAGDPDLAAAGLEPGEQSGAAAGVEMGGDLVEQQDRAPAGALADEVGMGEDDGEQQSLLLARRAKPGGLLLADMGHEQVRSVRPGERAAG